MQGQIKSKTEQFLPDKKRPTYKHSPEPSDQNEIYLRSFLRYYSLQNMQKILTDLFSNKYDTSINDSKFIAGDWVVAVNGFECQELNRFIIPSGWFNKRTYEYGFDLIELLSTSCGYDYKQALNILRQHFLLNHHNEKKPLNKLWTQVLHPLSVPYFYYEEKKSPLKSSFIYKNINGVPVGIVDYHIIAGANSSDDDKIVAIYFYTLWEQKENGSHSYWMELFPMTPYMLYNSDLLFSNKDGAVFIVENELLCDELLNISSVPDVGISANKLYSVPKKVFTTCPDGLINLQKCDLSLLKGKKVVLCLLNDSHVFQISHKIIKYFKDNDIPDITLYLYKKILTRNMKEFSYKLSQINASLFNDFHRSQMQSSTEYDRIINTYENCTDYINTINHNNNKIINCYDSYFDFLNNDDLPLDHKLIEKIKLYALIKFFKDKKGMTYEQIGHKLGICKATVGNYLNINIPKMTQDENKIFDSEYNQIVSKFESQEDFK